LLLATNNYDDNSDAQQSDNEQDEVKTARKYGTKQPPRGVVYNFGRV